MLNTKALKKLIEIKSVEGNQIAKEEALQLLIDQVLPLVDKKKIQVTQISRGASPAFYLSNHPTKQPDVMMYGHVDVVPALEQGFKPRIEKHGNATRLIGRGALDMKTFAQMEIELLKEIAEQGTITSLGLLLTSDEEIGGFEGSKIFMEKLKYRPRAILMPDGGRNWNLVCQEKGAVWVEFKICGTPAHGSRPWKGENALEIFNDYYKQATSALGQVTAHNRAGVSFNVGVINGGQAFNVVCSDLTVGIDIRHPEKITRKKILTTLQTLANQKEFRDKVSLKELIYCNPAKTDFNHPAVKKFVSLTKQHAKINLKPDYSCGASDSRWFTPYKIPVLVITPTGQDHHGDHEWVDLDSVEVLRKIYRDFILSGSATSNHPQKQQADPVSSIASR